MSNLIVNWWQGWKFSTALKKGNNIAARRLLKRKQSSGNSLSWLEKLFQDKLDAQLSLQETREQINALQKEKFELEEKLQYKESKLDFWQNNPQVSPAPIPGNLLPANPDFIAKVTRTFQIKELDPNLLSCVWIQEKLFNELEKNLFDYLKTEFAKFSSQEELKINLLDTYKQDILYGLKKGKDPQYNSPFTPYVYFMTYFLEGVYSAYLAWFLVYQAGLLPTKINLLDIGAGSGAMLHGLFYFLRSLDDFKNAPQNQICYCSLEKQSLLQHHGWQFWQQYIEPQTTAKFNTYSRFNNIDLFTYAQEQNQDKQLPKDFFDFIVISHCVFSERESKIKSHQAYRKIFQQSLKKDGYALIVVQGRKLFQVCEKRQIENQLEEEKVIQQFIHELGLQLVSYKYASSTGTRIPNKEKFKAMCKKLPTQRYISQLSQKYLNRNFTLHYGLDDYIILAKKQSN